MISGEGNVLRAFWSLQIQDWQIIDLSYNENILFEKPKEAYRQKENKQGRDISGS